jgi:hypothetical protein
MDLSICEELHMLLPTPDLGEESSSSRSSTRHASPVTHNHADEAAMLQRSPAVTSTPPMLKRRLSGASLTSPPDSASHEWKVFSKKFDDMEVQNASTIVAKPISKAAVNTLSLARRNSLPQLFEIQEDKPVPKTFHDAFHSDDVTVKSVLLSPSSWNSVRKLSTASMSIPDIMEEEPER